MSDFRTQALDVETNNALIRTLRASDFKDTEIFKLIRDFFFQLTPLQFEEYSRPMCSALISKLSDALICQLKEKDHDKLHFSRYNQTILSLLIFLGYKIWYSTSSIEQINTITNYFPNFGFLELQLFLKLFQSTFDSKDKESDFLSAVRLIILPLSCKQLSLTLNQPTNVNSLQFMTFRSLLQVLQSYGPRSPKINEQFQAIIFQFLANFSKNFKLLDNYIHNISYISICTQISFLVLLPSFKEQHLVDSITLLTNITRKIPPTFASIIDEIYQAVKYLLKAPDFVSSVPNTNSVTDQSKAIQNQTRNINKTPSQTNNPDPSKPQTQSPITYSKQNDQNPQNPESNTIKPPSPEQNQQNKEEDKSTAPQETPNVPKPSSPSSSAPIQNSLPPNNGVAITSQSQKLTPAQQQKLQQLQQKAQQVQQQQKQNPQQQIQLFQKHKEIMSKKLDLLNDFYPFVFSYKSMTPELFDKQISVVYKIIETVIKFQHHIATWMPKFCKFTANVILYKDQTYSKKTDYFYHLLKLVKVPSENSIRWLIIELFFSSIYLEISEIETELIKISLDKSSKPIKEARESIKKFNSLVECLSRSIRAFDTFLKFTRNATMVKQNPLYTFFDPNINQNTSQMISSIFAKIFYTIEISRKALEVTALWLVDFTPEEQFEKNIKNMKEINIFKLNQTKIITLHQTNIQFVIQALDNATPPLLDNAWKMFLHQFFYSQDLQFNSSLFSALSTNHEAFSYFMKNLVSFIEENFDHSFIIERVFSSLYLLFEKISQRAPHRSLPPQNNITIQPNTSQNPQFNPQTLTPAQIALLKAKQNAQRVQQAHIHPSKIKVPPKQVSLQQPIAVTSEKQEQKQPSNTTQGNNSQVPKQISQTVSQPSKSPITVTKITSSQAVMTPTAQAAAKLFESIISSSFKLINIAKEFIQSKKHSSSCLGLIISVTKFIDHICGNEHFSQVVYKPLSVHEMCNSIAITKESSRLIPKFVQRSLEVFSKFFQIKVTLPILNLLMLTAPYNQIECFKLIIYCYKLDHTLFENSPYLQQFSNFVFSQLDVSTDETRPLILKIINHLPPKIDVYDFDASHYLDNKVFLNFNTLSNDEMHEDLKIPLVSFYNAVYKSLIVNQDDDDVWKMFHDIHTQFFNENIEFDLKYRKLIQNLMSESFEELAPSVKLVIEPGELIHHKLKEENKRKEVMKEEFFKHFLDDIREERREFAMSHFLISFLPNIDNLDIKANSIFSNLFSFFTKQEQVTKLMKEIHFLCTENMMTNHLILITICELILLYIPQNIIHTLTFCELAILMITKTTTQRWKEKQKVEKRMHFIELDLLPDRIQIILKSIRDSLKPFLLQDIQTLFKEAKVTQNFLINLIIGELLSSYEEESQTVSNITKKIIDFTPLIEELESNDLTYYRVLGPLFRALPKAFKEVFPRVLSYCEEKLESIEKKDTNYQANFLVLAYPVLKNINDQTIIKKFHVLLPLCYQFFDRPPSYIACQAQLFVKEMFNSNIPQMQTEIKTYIDVYLKTKKFNYNLKSLDFGSMSWKLTSTTLFSPLFIHPKLFIDLIIHYLESFHQTIKNLVLQGVVKPELLFENLIEIFNLVSTQFIISYILEHDLFKKILTLMLSTFTTFSVVQNHIAKPLSVIMTFGLTEEELIKREKDQIEPRPSYFFNLLFEESLEAELFLRSYVVLSSMKNMEYLFISFISTHKKDILQLLDQKPEKGNQNPYLIARILLHFSNLDQEITTALIELHGRLIGYYKTQLEIFDCILFMELTEYLCNYFPNHFIAMSEMFVECEPFLIALFSQTFEKYFDFSSLSKDFLKDIYKRIEEKEKREKAAKEKDDSDENLYQLQENPQISLFSKEYFITMLSIVLKHRNDLLNSVINFIINEFEPCFAVSILNGLHKNSIQIDFSLFDPLQIYDSCQEDEDKFEALLFWRSSQSDEHFLILFQNLCQFIHFHNDTRIRQVFATLKVPSTVPDQTIAMKILSLFHNFSRNSQISPLLFKFLSNNKNYFHQITKTFMVPIQDHLRYIQTFAHKPQVLLSLIPLYSDILKCIILDDDCGLSQQEIQALNIHINSAGIPIVRLIIDQPDIKMHLEIIELMKAVGTAAKLFPSSSLSTYFFKQLISFNAAMKETHFSAQQSSPYPQNVQQPRPQPQQSVQTVNLTKNSKEKFFFELFLEGMSKIAEGVAQNSESNVLDAVIQIFVEIIQSKEAIIWPSALYSIVKILKNSKWRDKVLEKIKPILTPEFFARTLPVYFHYLPYLDEKNYEYLFEQAKRIFINESKGPVPEMIITSILNEMNPYILDYIVQMLLSPNAGSFEACILHCAFQPMFKGKSFVKKLIDCLRNKKLAISFFNRENPSDDIIQQLPIEALIILSTKQNNMPKLALEKLKKDFTFKEIIFASLTTQRMNIPYSMLLSTFTGHDLMHIIPFFSISQDLPQFSNTLFKENKKREMSIVFGMNTIVSKSEKVPISAHVLSEFPDFQFSDKQNINETDIFNALSMTIDSFKEIGNSVSNSPISSPFIDENYQEQSYRDIYLDNSIGDTQILNLIKKETSIEKKIEGIFMHYDLVSKTATRKGLGEYLIIHEVKRIISSLKKHSEHFKAFKFELNPVFSPQLHHFYREIRDATCAKFTIPDYQAINEKHMKRFKKSLFVHNQMKYSDFFSIEQRKEDNVLKDLENVENNLHKILILLINSNDTDPKHIENCAIALFKVKGNKSQEPYLLWIKDFKKYPRLSDLISSKTIPFAFSPLFVEKIAKDSSLNYLINHINAAFYLSLHCLGIKEIPIDIQLKLNSFLSPILQVIGSEPMKVMKKFFKYSTKLAQTFRSDNVSLPKDFERKCEDLTEKIFTLNPGAIKSIDVDQFHPPLIDLSFAETKSLSFIIPDQTSPEISIQCLLTNGESISYKLTPRSLMTSKLSLFTNLINNLLKKHPPSYKRGQKLASLYSIEISEDSFLTQTQSNSLYDLSSLSILLDAYKNSVHKKREQSKQDTTKNFTKKQFFTYQNSLEYSFWFSLCGYRYSALSLLQIVSGGCLPSPFDMSIDIQNTIFLINDFIKEGRNQSIPRLCGKITQFIDEIIAKGPYRIGFLSAADCLFANKSKLQTFIKTLYDEDNFQEFEQVISHFSVISSEPSVTVDAVSTLIETSYNCDQNYAIPWI